MWHRDPTGLPEVQIRENTEGAGLLTGKADDTEKEEEEGNLESDDTSPKRAKARNAQVGSIPSAKNIRSRRVTYTVSV